MCLILTGSFIRCDAIVPSTDEHALSLVFSSLHFFCGVRPQPVYPMCHANEFVCDDVRHRQPNGRQCIRCMVYIGHWHSIIWRKNYIYMHCCGPFWVSWHTETLVRGPPVSPNTQMKAKRSFRLDLNESVCIACMMAWEKHRNFYRKWNVCLYIYTR